MYTFFVLATNTYCSIINLVSGTLNSLTAHVPNVHPCRRSKSACYMTGPSSDLDSASMQLEIPLYCAKHIQYEKYGAGLRAKVMNVRIIEYITCVS